jgi:hypothetical protein
MLLFSILLLSNTVVRLQLTKLAFYLFRPFLLRWFELFVPAGGYGRDNVPGSNGLRCGLSLSNVFRLIVFARARNANGRRR